MAETTNNEGYWMVASDGGIFSFGDAQFSGSMGGTTSERPDRRDGRRPRRGLLVGRVRRGDIQLRSGAALLRLDGRSSI